MIKQSEFPILQAVAQAAFYPQRLCHALVELRLEELEIVAPTFLGVVHGRVRILDQLLHAVTILRKQADADTGRNMKRKAARMIGFIQNAQGVACGLGSVFSGSDVRQHREEFVSAQPPYQVLAAHACGKPPGRFLEHGIAYVVAISVVNRLETVDVDENERAKPVTAPRTFEHALGKLVKHCPVGQFRQRVVLRDVEDPFLNLLAFVDVLGDADDTQWISAVVALHDLALRKNPAPFARFFVQAEFFAKPRRLALQMLFQRLQHPEQIIRMNQLLPDVALRLDFTRQVTQNREQFVVAGHDVGAQIDVPKAELGDFYCQCQALFAFLTCPLGAVAFGNVAQHRDMRLLAGPFGFHYSHLGNLLFMTRTDNVDIGGLAGRDRKAERLPEQLGFRGAEQRGRGHVGVLDHALGVDNDKRIGTALNDVAQARLAGCQLRGQFLHQDAVKGTSFVHFLALRIAIVVYRRWHRLLAAAGQRASSGEKRLTDLHSLVVDREFANLGLVRRTTHLQYRHAVAHLAAAFHVAQQNNRISERRKLVSVTLGGTDDRINRRGKQCKNLLLLDKCRKPENKVALAFCGGEPS